jgi:CBS-domain-containing membrane protein
MYGHLIGAVCGVAAQQWVTMPMDTPLVGAPLAVAVAIMLMAATGTTHPPAGGTACIAAMALEGSDVAELGWGMVLTAEIGAALLVLAALLLNNLLPDRRYPQGWS